MRRILPVIAASLSFLFLTGAGQPAPQRLYQAYSAEEKAVLDKISASLNSIRTLKSAFVQIAPNGNADQGELYLEKPGRIRFEFNKPSPLLIVATDGRLYVRNSRLNTVDSYDLSDTPLGILLNEKIDLARNKSVIGVSETNGAILVQARTSTNRNRSNITLVFATPGLELRQWTVKDNQGGITTVALQSPQVGGALDQALFTKPVKAPSKLTQRN